MLTISKKYFICNVIILLIVELLHTIQGVEKKITKFEGVKIRKIKFFYLYCFCFGKVSICPHLYNLQMVFSVRSDF